MVTTRIFNSDNGQAVRIPAELAYGDPVQELTITRTGDVITIYPMRRSLRQAVAELREMAKPSEVEPREKPESWSPKGGPP